MVGLRILAYDISDLGLRILMNVPESQITGVNGDMSEGRSTSAILLWRCREMTSPVREMTSPVRGTQLSGDELVCAHFLGCLNDLYLMPVSSDSRLGELHHSRELDSFLFELMPEETSLKLDFFLIVSFGRVEDLNLL